MTPDLELRITTQGTRLAFELTSEHSQLRFFRKQVGATDLAQAPGGYVERLFEQLSAMARQDGAESSPRTMATLAGIGQRLYRELLPDELKRAYRAIRGALQDRQLSLLIISDEPWIPWELVKPYEDLGDGSPIIDDPFWAESFALTRWLAGSMLPRQLIVAQAAVVAPDLNLDHAREEQSYFERLLQDGQLAALSAVSRYADVDAALRSGAIQLYHVATHGGFHRERPDEAAIQLEDDLLRASAIIGPVQSGIRQAQPLVFLNACHTGRQDFALTGLGGWTQEFVKAGASAFVGAQWEAHDELALRFATTFYEALRAGVPLGLAAHQARLIIKEQAPANPTWLAYAVYGHPDLRVTFAAEGAPKIILPRPNPIISPVTNTANETGAGPSATRTTQQETPTKADPPQPEPNPVKPGPQADPNRQISLSPKQRIELARLLLECATMQNPGGRAQVIGALKPAIRNAAPSGGTTLIDLVGLLKICENHKQGIQDLIEELRNYDDGTIPMQAVDDFLAGC